MSDFVHFPLKQIRNSRRSKQLWAGARPTTPGGRQILDVDAEFTFLALQQSTSRAKSIAISGLRFCGPSRSLTAPWAELRSSSHSALACTYMHSKVMTLMPPRRRSAKFKVQGYRWCTSRRAFPDRWTFRSPSARRLSNFPRFYSVASPLFRRRHFFRVPGIGRDNINLRAINNEMYWNGEHVRLNPNGKIISSRSKICPRTKKCYILAFSRCYVIWYRLWDENSSLEV